MPATWNPDVTVNVFGETQGINVKQFGRIVHCTADVEAGFTELYRIYESNSDAQADADLSANAKAAAASFFSQEKRPKDVAIAKVTYKDVGTEMKDSLDTLLAAWTDFFAICCQDRSDTNNQEMAEWAAANERLCFLQSSTAAIKAGTGGNLFETLQTADNPWTAGIWHDDDAEYADLAWLARFLSANPDYFSSVAYDKQLTGVTPPTLTAAEKAAVVGYDANLYLELLGDNVTGPGKLFNADWIDDLLLEQWFKARVQEALARLKIRMSNSNSKIPYTNHGLAMIEAEIRGVINRGVIIGHFEKGSEIIATPDIEDVLAADILARQCQIPVTVTKTGGIKDITINVGVING